MAELLRWSDGLSVGIQEIDEQHKVLVDLLNQLNQAIHEKRASEAGIDILTRLAEYTRIHFAVEESLMRIFDYPGFEQHKKEHHALVEQVVKLQEKLKSGKATIGFELMHFLKIWLTKHIIESDKQYAPFFLEAGIKASWAKQSDSWMKRLFG